MGYVAVTGGQEAIQASIQLLKEYRSKGERPVDLQVLRDRMGSAACGIRQVIEDQYHSVNGKIQFLCFLL